MRIFILFIMCVNLLFASEKHCFCQEQIKEKFESDFQNIADLLSELLPKEKEDDSKFGTVADFKETLSDLLSYVYVKVPKEYVPFANTLKAVFPLKDNQVDYNLSYGEAKKMLSPLKEAFMDLIKNPKTYQFLKSLEAYDRSFSGYTCNLEKKHINRGKIFSRHGPAASPIFDKLRENPCDDAYRVFIAETLRELNNFYRVSKSDGYSYKYIIFSSFFLHITLSQSKEVIEQYCPLSFQKLIFPFYFIDFFLKCINACNGMYEGNWDDYKLDDLNDDMPFIDVLWKVSTLDKASNPKRVIENFYLMTEDPFLFEEE